MTEPAEFTITAAQDHATVTVRSQGLACGRAGVLVTVTSPPGGAGAAHLDENQACALAYLLQEAIGHDCDTLHLPPAALAALTGLPGWAAEAAGPPGAAAPAAVPAPAEPALWAALRSYADADAARDQAAGRLAEHYAQRAAHAVAAAWPTAAWLVVDLPGSTRGTGGTGSTGALASRAELVAVLDGNRAELACNTGTDTRFARAADTVDGAFQNIIGVDPGGPWSGRRTLALAAFAAFGAWGARP